MKKWVLVILFILLAWLFIRFVLGGSEDDWICENGQWVQHGVPSAPEPSGICE